MENVGLKVEFSNVSDGNMSFAWGNEADVIKNRQQFLEKCAIKADDATIVYLEHGTKIYKIDTPKANLLEKSKQQSLVGDGLMTNKKGDALMLVVADCIPAALYDPNSKQLAVLHAGRKGVELNILKQAVEMLDAERLEDLILVAGPAISGDSYVFDTKDGVDTELWGDNFKKGDDEKYHMYIKDELRRQAIDLGLSENNLHISKIDTYTDQKYYSHRRSMATGEAEGRFAIIASIL